MSGLTGFGSGIRSEANARQRAKDMVGNRASPTGLLLDPGVLRTDENSFMIEFQLAQNFKADRL